MESIVESTQPGIVIGMLVSVDDTGNPYVVFPENQLQSGVQARSLVTFEKRDIGTEVALSFELGDVTKPLILGKIMRPTIEADAPDGFELVVDDTSPPLEITGEQEVTLRCGKASITLTKAGKIILRGTYISSRSSGMNRIKGGSVQLN